MENQFKKENLKTTVLLIIIVFMIAAGYAYTKYSSGRNNPPTVANNPPSSSAASFKKFTSVEEFKTYLQERSDYGDVRQITGLANEVGSAPRGLPTTSSLDFGATDSMAPVSIIPSRISGTNIQVVGIDEPDILKTNGKEIYYSSENNLYYSAPEPLSFPDGDFDIMPPLPPQYSAETKIFKAFPPAELAKRAGIPMIGQLLISNDILIIIGTEKIVGYDISNATNPKETWTIDLEDSDQISSARLYNGKLFLVSSTEINRGRPCPFVPINIKSLPMEVGCRDIYYPEAKFSVHSTYTATIINPTSGSAEQTVSFVGSDADSVIFMSTNALYVTYSYEPSPINFVVNFLKTDGRDLISPALLARLEKLITYDISENSKMNELELIMEEWEANLNDDESLRFENEIENRLDTYLKSHLRETSVTDIVKIGLSNFQVVATGQVPGYPLNQFSLDEYQGNLRVATTVGEFQFSNATENDVYVLNDSLAVTGSIKGLGEGEKIYSVRFVNDRGYVVTFRQTDPFYVLDLSNPNKPEKKGELKIPGYSSYLHPIKDRLILGIGMENSKVKLSLFDVSNAENPREVSKYSLDEYWSEILNTQYAFLLDSEHQVFFIPGSRGGYVFSYQGNQLSLKRAVSGIEPRRALYLDNYLYLVSDNKIVVLNETDWVEVKSLDF